MSTIGAVRASMESLSTFSSEIDAEDIRQLLHEDLSHLQRSHYNLQVLAG